MTKTNFNSFYFLHIQKTGGRNYMYNFLDPIKNTLLNSNIAWLNKEINGNAHNQWSNDINNLTYVTCIFRDPCKQIVSLYVHDEFFKSNHFLNKKTFLKWFEEEAQNYAANFQSKNIILPTINYKSNYKIYDNDKITKNNVLNQISKISLFFKPEILIQTNQLTIQNKILSDLNIGDIKINNRIWKENEYKNNYSKEIYDSLSIKDKEYIKTVSNIDSEIYETDSLFWRI